jgi:hypothetical protein
MSISIDEALAYARDLTERIRHLPDGNPERAALESKLEDYRTEIRLATDRGRSLDSLQRDLAHVSERMDDLSRQRIDAPFSAMSFSLNDPEAYSLPINKAIDENNADTVATLKQRMAELQRAISMVAEASEPQE